MKKTLIILVSFAVFYSCGTSKNTTTVTEIKTNSNTEISNESTEKGIIERPVYHGSPTILTAITHTKLEVDFNWAESQLNGVATLTCKPHFYSTDSLILDAKAMEILSVKIGDKSLNYKYDDAKFLRIGLDKKYTRDETYNIVIDYIAKPEEKEIGGSSAISQDKGLYFINPKGEKKNQMTQVWTQGETEGSSVWFPTIDRPNQRTSQEIYITVEDKYVTLSNGLLISSKDNGDGTRTDYWKQEKPHAPYLFMLAAGEFKIVKDSYTRNDGSEMDVWYYVEPEWEEHAQAIFGVTPEMIKYFSDLLGVEYVWDKYHQIIVREYVSGAMENTGAVVFGDFCYKTERELLDNNDQSTIAHELFHHWFGDLVTLESWSNLPLNESFANYSQYLWDEYKYGVDEADYNAESEKEGFFALADQRGHHNMIWYDYESQEDMFDGHAYNKGGRILHMLRTHIGDEAFFAALKDYLETYAYQATELAHLRLSFEKITGEDLNWFFNQWFHAARYPRLKITQDVGIDEITLTIKQTQDLSNTPLYKLPMKIGVYANDKHYTYPIVVDKSEEKFTFKFEGKLQNVIVDEDRVLLGKINYNKPRDWYAHQYHNAPKYMDRKEAIDKGIKVKTKASEEMLLAALDDSFWAIRQLAISELDQLSADKQDLIYTKLKNIAQEDSHSHVRSSALKTLSYHFFANKFEEETRSTLKSAIENDKSYMVVSSGLNGLTKGSESDVNNALALAKQLETEPSSSLKASIIDVYSNHGDISNIDFMADALINRGVQGYDAIMASFNFTSFFKGLDIKTQSKYFYVYEELTNAGGYIGYVLPMLVMNVQQDVAELVEELKKEDKRLESEGKTGEATIVQGKLKEAQNYLRKVNSLAMKVVR